MFESSGIERLIRPDLVTVDEARLRELGEAARALASAEGFEAHARAVERRLKTGC